MNIVLIDTTRGLSFSMPFSSPFAQDTFSSSLCSRLIQWSFRKNSFLIEEMTTSRICRIPLLRRIFISATACPKPRTNVGREDAWRLDEGISFSIIYGNSDCAMIFFHIPRMDFRVTLAFRYQDIRYNTRAKKFRYNK
jgi:hypothetical protein